MSAAMQSTARRQNPSIAAPHKAAKRFFDHRLGAYTVRVSPGQFYATSAKDEVVVTVLGSCVAACIRDVRTGYGGLNHFMLPESESGEWNGVTAANRYGNFAMEALINSILRFGSLRSDLEAKLFGGADFSATMVGRSNAEFARRYLADENIHVAAMDLGGSRGRKIQYWPSTGRVMRQLMKPSDAVRITTEEQEYNVSIREKPLEGDIELFE